MVSSADLSSDTRKFSTLRTNIDPENEACDHFKHLEDVEAQLLEAETLVSRLKIQRMTLKSTINDINDRIIGRVPPEIAAYIFLIYVEMHTQSAKRYLSDYEYPMTPAPLRLGAVCSKWREIAWSSPELWSTLAIDIYSSGRKKMPCLTWEWLGRSGSLPLTIHLYTLHVHDNICNFADECEDAIGLINAILPFSARWYTVNFDFPSEIMEHIGSIFGGQVLQATSILKHLLLRRIDGPSGSPIAVSPRKLTPAHSPEYVRLFSVQVMEFRIKWAKITKIEAVDLPLQDCIRIFRAPRLEECNLYNVRKNGELDGPLRGPIVNTSLRSLTLSEYSGSAEYLLGTLLDNLKLPSLQELDYNGSSRSSFPFPASSVASLSRRSNCQIKRLALRRPVIGDEEIIEILEATPSLESLDLELNSENNITRLFERLSTPMADDVGYSFLPALGWLYIDAHHHFPWSSVPDIFDPQQCYSTQIVSSHAPSTALQRGSLILKLSMADSTKDYYIDKPSLDRILKLRELSGVCISISCLKKNADDEEYTFLNLLEESSKFHSPPEPATCIPDTILENGA